MTFKQFFIQCIESIIVWLETTWREAKTEANLNQEIRKYHEAA